MTRPLPEGTQEVIQGGAIPLVADTCEQTSLHAPYALEINICLVITKSLESVAGAVVIVLALDGSTTDERGGSGEERDKGGD